MCVCLCVCMWGRGGACHFAFTLLREVLQVAGIQSEQASGDPLPSVSQQIPFYYPTITSANGCVYSWEFTIKG